MDMNSLPELQLEPIGTEAITDLRTLELVENAQNEARVAGIDGVEAWNLPDGTVVAFTTPAVPFGQVRWVEKTWATPVGVAA